MGNTGSALIGNRSTVKVVESGNFTYVASVNQSDNRDWLIKRIESISGVTTIAFASIANNTGYATVSAAIAAITSLVYGDL